MNMINDSFRLLIVLSSLLFVGHFATRPCPRHRSEPSKGDPMLDRTPLGRFAEPWEMAHGVIFLVSPSSSQMCGQMLLLDGGITTTGTPCGEV